MYGHTASCTAGPQGQCCASTPEVLAHHRVSHNATGGNAIALTLGIKSLSHNAPNATLLTPSSEELPRGLLPLTIQLSIGAHNETAMNVLSRIK